MVIVLKKFSILDLKPSATKAELIYTINGLLRDVVVYHLLKNNFLKKYIKKPVSSIGIFILNFFIKGWVNRDYQGYYYHYTSIS